MIKTILTTVAICLVASLAIAQQLEITPKYTDLTPNDNFMDAGTNYNPYIIKDGYGNQKATIKSKYIDLTPNDGFMDAGTTYNPYVIDWDN